MTYATPIQSGQVKIDAVLVGGPSDMLPSRRIFHGLALDTVTVIYHWSARTEVAE